MTHLMTLCAYHVTLTLRVHVLNNHIFTQNCTIVYITRIPSIQFMVYLDPLGFVSLNPKPSTLVSLSFTGWLVTYMPSAAMPWRSMIRGPRRGVEGLGLDKSVWPC